MELIVILIAAIAIIYIYNTTSEKKTKHEKVKRVRCDNCKVQDKCYSYQERIKND